MAFGTPKGFTLIEIIVAVTILLVITSVGISNYSGYNQGETVRQTALTVKNDLRYLQGKALSGDKPAGCTKLTGWQMSFTATTYTTEATCTNGAVAITQRTTPLPRTVTFSPVPSTIIYYVLTGGTNVNSVGSINVVGNTKTYLIQVGARGNINDKGFQ